MRGLIIHGSNLGGGVEMDGELVCIWRLSWKNDGSLQFELWWIGRGWKGGVAAYEKDKRGFYRNQDVNDDRKTRSPSGMCSGV